MKKLQAAGVKVHKAKSSCTNQCALEETADYTNLPIELATKHVDSDHDAESVVYDEVQDIRSRAQPPTSSTVAAGSSGTLAAAQEPITQFQLTVNSAYSTPINKI